MRRLGHQQHARIRESSRASGKRAVDPGKTRTFRLKLTKTGRKTIKAGGKARKVRVRVRLPGGDTFGTTIRLSRRR